MLYNFFQLIVERPRNTLSIVAGITLLSILFIPNLKIDFSIEHLFSEKDPMVERYSSFRDTFGREDNIITIIYKPSDHLEKKLYVELEDLVYQITDLTGVQDVASIFTLSDVDLRAYIGNIHDSLKPWNKDRLAQTLKYIQLDPSIGSKVISRDLKNGALIISLTDNANNHRDRTNLLNKIKELTKTTSPDWVFSGVSVLRTEYVSYMVRDNFLFLPPIAVILICILGFIFRNWVQVFLPLLTVLITVIWLLGFMGAIGLDINIITYIVPTLLFIIGISDAIHIQARFRENLSKDNTNPKEVMLVTMVQMSKVILLTSLTTAIGFLALLTTSIRIIQEFGLEIAIGVMIAWLVSILVVPSGILLLKGFQYQNQNIFSTPLEKLSLSIIKRPWAFIIIPILISGVAIIKVKDISTDASLMDDLRPKNKLYQDLKFTEKYFGGVLPFEVLLHLDQNMAGAPEKIASVDIIPILDQIETNLKSYLTESRFFSLSDLLESVKRIRNEDPSLPYKQEMIDLVIENQSDEQIKLINSEGNTLRISGLIENKTSSEMEEIYTKLDSLSESFPPYLSIEYTGTTVVALKTNNYLVQSLFNSLGIALLFISLIMAFMFRAKYILLASLLTNLIPIFTVLGILAWLNISIRPPTAMTFSVALGIAVDDSLHFLLRYRKELSKGLNRPDAIKNTIINTGSALMITTTVLVSGFSILVLSAFLPTYQFGLLSSGMIGAALICDLTLLPALCLILPNPNKE
tara:strand:+ start:2394 stop:4637 length:2244 start_codon:yes stop_codon:yes gene_type:complete